MKQPETQSQSNEHVQVAVTIEIAIDDARHEASQSAAAGKDRSTNRLESPRQDKRN